MNTINNLKIRTRLILFFSVILVFTATGLIYTSMQSKTITKQVDMIYNVQLLSMEFLIEADRDAYQSSLAINQALFKITLNDSSTIGNLITDADENYAQIGQRYSKFESLSDVVNEADNVSLNKQFHDNYLLLGNKLEEIKQLILSGNMNDANSLYFNEYSQIFGSMRGAMDAFTEISLEGAGEAHSISKSIGKQILVNSFIIAIVIIVLIILSSFLLSTSINNPVSAAVNYLSEIASGNLTQHISEKHLNRKDEIGIMMQKMDVMNTKLSEIVSSAQTNSLNIASAGIQLSQTSQQLAHGANRQASSVEEISSTMEEIASNIQQNAENAKKTKEISKSAQVGIKELVSTAEEAFSAQREISDKIKIINDIAFQTNILALNAAVEASRAGEHGKGFAVVAQEVRKLAELSKAAADEIMSRAKKGLDTAEKAGMHMTKTLPEIENTTSLVQEINAASQEQRTGVNQTNTELQMLNELTQQNAAASEELASSSEELSSQAEELQSIISFFKTKENDFIQQSKANTNIETTEKQKVSVKKDALGAILPKKLKDDDYESF
jgi:methyl-accepting chemotaxis protein